MRPLGGGVGVGHRARHALEGLEVARRVGRDHREREPLGRAVGRATLRERAGQEGRPGPAALGLGTREKKKKKKKKKKCGCERSHATRG